MDDLTKRPWWRWTTGLVVRVEGWGGRPVPCGVVVGSGEMARVADEWGTTPRVVELQAMAGVRVTPDLDSPATVGCLLERLREVAQEAEPVVHVALYSRLGLGPAVSRWCWPGAADEHFYFGDNAATTLIRALDDVTGVAP